MIRNVTFIKKPKKAFLSAEVVMLSVFTWPGVGTLNPVL
jgi:hypothetical protein